MANNDKANKPDSKTAKPKPQDDKSTARPLTPDELKDVAGGAIRMQEQKQK